MSENSSQPPVAPAKPTSKPKPKAKSRARARARRPASSSSDSEPEAAAASGSESDAEEDDEPESPSEDEDEDEAASVPAPKPATKATPFDQPKWSEMPEDGEADKVEAISFEDFGRSGLRGRGRGRGGRGGATPGGRRELTEEEVARKREKAKLQRQRRKERLAAERAAKSEKPELPAEHSNAREHPAPVPPPAQADGPPAPTASSSKPKPTPKKQRNKPAPVVSAESNGEASASASIPSGVLAAPKAEAQSADARPSSPAGSSFPEPRRNNREAYTARVAADPQYAPRVGSFWQHDQRHYQSGQVGEGEYAGLRQLGGYWRGDRGGRGRGGFARGRGGFVADAPGPVKESSWGHEGYEEMSKQEQSRRGGPGRGRGRGASRGSFQRFPSPAVTQASFDVASDMQSLSVKPPMTTAEALEEVVTREAAEQAPVVKLPGSHEPPSVKTVPEPRQAPQPDQPARASPQPTQQHQQRLQQQHPQMHPRQHEAQQHPAQAFYPANPSYLPPGVGVTETGAFYNLATGAPMGFMPTPAPTHYYPEQGYYPPDYRQMYTPSPGRDSPFYPPQAPLGYFAPPRPAQKVQIRAPDAHYDQQQQQQFGNGAWYGQPPF